MEITHHRQKYSKDIKNYAVQFARENLANGNLIKKELEKKFQVRVPQSTLACWLRKANVKLQDSRRHSLSIEK